MSSHADPEPREAEVISLMNRVLRGGDPIAPEYPLVFDGELPGRLIDIVEDGKVRSACAIVAREFITESASVRIGLIGSVVTDPSWRGKGLATRTLRVAEAALKADGCAFALLWGEDPEFYFKRGYAPIGGELNFVVPLSLARELPDSEHVREATPEDAAALHELYGSHATRVARTRHESDQMHACPAMRTLVVDRDDRAVAYASVGRGEDLTNAVHEWAGRARDVLGLLRAHLEATPPSDHTADADCLFFMAPTAEREVVAELEALEVRPAAGMLGLGKIIDPIAAARLLGELLGPSAVVRCEPGRAGSTVRIDGPRSSAALDEQGLLALLLGVPEVRPDVQGLLRDLGLEGVALPLEPYAWGLDSI